MKNCDPRGGVNFYPRGIILTLLEDHYMMLCAKHESSEPCSFRQEYLKKMKPYLLTLWPTYATNWNVLNYFGRGTPRYNSCEVWSKSNEWCQRRSCLKILLTHRRTLARTHGWWTTDNGPSQKLTLSTLCSGELKTISLGIQRNLSF